MLSDSQYFRRYATTDFIRYEYLANVTFKYEFINF